MFSFRSTNDRSTVAQRRYPSYLLKATPPVVYTNEDVMDMLVPQKFGVRKSSRCVKANRNRGEDHRDKAPSIRPSFERADVGRFGKLSAPTNCKKTHALRTTPVKLLLELKQYESRLEQRCVSVCSLFATNNKGTI